jgi:hypothetical protein
MVRRMLWLALFVAGAACGADASTNAGADASMGSAGTGSAGTGTAGTGSAGSSTAGSMTTEPMMIDDVVTYGDVHEGGEFHLGPVDWDETQWHNACAPGDKYAPAIRALEGELLAGLWNGIADVAQYCDACIYVTTAKGKSALLRVVTYGDTSPNSIDTSPAAYQLLNSGEYPRTMSWRFAKCADTGKLVYEFQSGSSEWWTSLWLRNARVPLAKVEVQSANHASWTALERGGDGTLTDAAGFGQGKFSIRSTGSDGSQVIDTFDWPSGGLAGAVLVGAGNFD